MRTLLAVLAALAVAAVAGTAAPRVQKAPFGTADGKPVQVFTLTNRNGLEAKVMTWGATLVSLKAPDRNGTLAGIVLGYDSFESYLAGSSYYGATVGRFANRIANGRFTLDGKTYQIARNNGPNSLHGGIKGFDKRIWVAVSFETKQGPGVRLSYVSADGEEGFPGRLTARVTYQLRNDNSLAIDYRAVTTAPTVVNFTNHSYFNLSGDFRHPITDEVLSINADRFTPMNAEHIPSSELRSVEGTPFDFRKATEIGARIDADDEQIRIARGYDHNWVLAKPKPGALTLAAAVSDPVSGRVLEVRTTEPGLQVYTGNFHSPVPGTPGSVSVRRAGLALETQHFPDSPNQPSFPSTLLRPGEVFTSRTVFSFTTAK